MGFGVRYETPEFQKNLSWLTFSGCRQPLVTAAGGGSWFLLRRRSGLPTRPPLSPRAGVRPGSHEDSLRGLHPLRVGVGTGPVITHGCRGASCTPPQCRQEAGVLRSQGLAGRGQCPHGVWQGGAEPSRGSALPARVLGETAGLAGSFQLQVPRRQPGPPCPSWLVSSISEPLNSLTGVAQGSVLRVGPGGGPPGPSPRSGLSWAKFYSDLRAQASLLTQQP